MPGTFFFPPPLFSDPDIHHGTCVTHVPWCMSGSLNSGFLWSRWRGKRFRHSPRMPNPEFNVSGKRTMASAERTCPQSMMMPWHGNASCCTGSLWGESIGWVKFVRIRDNIINLASLVTAQTNLFVCGPSSRDHSCYELSFWKEELPCTLHNILISLSEAAIPISCKDTTTGCR